MYRLRRIFVIFSSILIFITSSILAQDTGGLRGLVTDSTNGEALIFCNVYIEELYIGSSTNDKGYFIISNIPANKNYTVIISYVGYDTKTVQAFISENKLTHLDIELNPSSIQLGTVEKIGEKIIEKNTTDIGLQRLTMRELEALPQGVETDIMRSLQYLPGVRSTGDISARYYVRGGASNQNLVLLNDVTVYNPFHGLGLFSIVDPDLISNIEFYKGGFTAEFGGRLSSVLKLISKDGNKKNFGAILKASFLTLKGMVEGPLPHGSFILTGRKSFSNAILRKFLNDKNAPFDFYDMAVKVNYSNPDFIKGSKFDVHAFYSGDRMDRENPFMEDFKWNNNIMGIKWYQVYDVPLLSEFNLSMSSFDGELLPNLSNALYRKNELTDISMDMNFTYFYDRKDELGVGLNLSLIKTSYIVENKLGTFTDLQNGGANISLFIKYKLMSFERFGLDFGTRFNLISLNKNGLFKFEPRVSATYVLSSEISIKAAWGIYQQELTTLSNESEVVSLFEPWIIIPSYLDPSRATHYIAGIEISPFDNVSLDIEGYYKKMRNIPSLNLNKQVNTDPDLLSGSGESYGLEFLLKINPYPFSFTGSYSLAWAFLEVDDWLYYPKYDARHTVNLIFNVDLGKGWRTGATWIFSSGLPFTPFVGYYDRLIFDDFHSGRFIFDSYSPYSILGDRNINRLPTYHRLDFSLSKKIELDLFNLYIDFYIINVYDRKNLFYFELDTGERVNMLPFLPTVTIKAEI